MRDEHAKVSDMDKLINTVRSMMGYEMTREQINQSLRERGHVESDIMLAYVFASML